MKDKTRFKEVIQMSPYPIMIHAEDGEILEISEAWTEITGYTQEDIPTIEDWTEKAYGKRMKIVKEIIDDVFNKKTRLNHGEFTIKTKQGKKRIWDFGSAPLGWLADGRRLIMSIAKDVTEQKKLNEELEESEKSKRLLLDSTVEGIYGLDTKGNCTFANPACVKILGYKDAKYLLGKNMHELIHHTRKDGTHYPEDKCKIYQAFRENKATNVDDELLWRADKTSFPAEYKSNPIISDNKAIGSVVTFIDITEKKKAEENIKKLNVDLKERIKELKGLYSLGRLIEDSDDLKDLFERFMKDVVPPSMQYPDKTFARIELMGKEYNSHKGRKVNSPFYLSAPILVGKKKRGTLIIGYIEKLPFIPIFEQNLVNGYAERLGKIIDTFETEIKLIESNKKQKEISLKLKHELNKRIKTEKKLRNQKEFSDAILLTLIDGVDIVDEKGKIIYQNHIFEKTFGKNSINKKCYELYKDSRKQCKNCPLKHPVKIGETKKLISTGIMGGRTCEILHTGILLPNGKKGILEVFRDITDMIKYEHDLKSSRDRLNDIINNISEFVVSIDKFGRITAWNKTAESKTGFSHDEILGSNYLKEKNIDQINPLIEYLNLSLKNKKSEVNEILIRDKNNNPILILTSTSFIKDNNNNIEGIVLTGIDISNQRKIIQKLVPGNSYLSYNESFTNIIDIINSFGKEYSYLCLSRGDFRWLKEKLPDKTIFLLMSEKKKKENMIMGKPENILKEIKSHLNENKKTIIIITRLEYISLVYGFDSLLRFLYQLNDFIKSTDDMAVIHVWENLLNKRELMFLKQEFITLPIVEENDIYLNQKLIKILKFISNKNSFQTNVPFNLISSEFKFARRTTKQCVEQLQVDGYLRTEKEGRLKNIYITEKGRDLLSKISN